MMNSEPLTVIFFSCRRMEILYESMKAFVDLNTYPVNEFIIVNDSADPEIHKRLQETYINATFVFNKENVGLMRSIDLGYKYIKTEYFFHAEDDWKLTNGKFIENSMKIMKDRPEIEEVWPQLFNIHDAEPEIYESDGIKYKLVTQFHLKGQDGPYGWHGFSTAFTLKRMSDYLKVAPYCDIPYQGNIWMREQAIGEKYRLLGYRTAVMLNDYGINIGYGKSEYTVKGNDGKNDK